VTDGFRTRDNWSHKPQIHEASRGATRDSAPLADASARDSEPSRGALPRPVAASIAELERGILAAVAMGLADVARTLSAQLEERRRAPPGKVVVLDIDKSRRQR